MARRRRDRGLIAIALLVWEIYRVVVRRGRADDPAARPAGAGGLACVEVQSLLAPRVPAALLILSDALAIVVFATIGLISHDHAPSAAGYARDALPFLGTWFGAALLSGSPTGHPGRLLATWAVAVPAGVVIRAAALGRDANGKEGAFLLVALVTILVFVVALRSLLALTSAARPARRAAR